MASASGPSIPVELQIEALRTELNLFRDEHAQFKAEIVEDKRLSVAGDRDKEFQLRAIEELVSEGHGRDKKQDEAIKELKEKLIAQEVRNGELLQHIQELEARHTQLVEDQRQMLENIEE